MDWLMKHPRISHSFLVTSIGVLGISYLFYLENIGEGDLARTKTPEKPFEYSFWANSYPNLRGEWDNNFSCWTSSPDCGKDFKQRYTR